MDNPTGCTAILRRCTISSTAVLLSVLASISHAGPIDDALNRLEGKINTINSRVNSINVKVNTITSRTGTIFNNTNGVQQLVSNVQDMTSEFRTGTFDDLRESLYEVQDLADFIRDRRESAGNSDQYPDLAVLVSSLESIMSVLQDDSNSRIDFGVLTQLLQVLPDSLLAVAARAVSKAGIDADFVDRAEQVEDDLAVLNDALAQETEVQAQAVSTQGVLTVGSIPTLPGRTDCSVFNTNREEIKRARLRVFFIGVNLKLAGKLLSGAADTVQTETKIGIHGYAGTAIKTDVSGAIGEVMAGIGDALLQTAGSVKTKLNHCEVLWHQQLVLQRQDMIMREVCVLSRFRSPACTEFGP